MRHVKINFKQFVLLLGFMMSTTFCVAIGTTFIDDFSNINVKVAHVQGAPKGSTIQAYIDGHTLTVVFTENLGQVTVEVTTVTGNPVTCKSTYTPNGVILYIANTGDYIVTFTLSNGDEYYGEFTVTD